MTVVAVVLSVFAASVGIAAWWFRGRSPRGPLQTRHPIVLLHGAFGFDEVVLTDRHAYFRGVRERLMDHGNEVHRPTVAPVAGVAHRAAQLAEWIRALPPGKVNVIAHSMGGIDARYAITHLGLHDRVASLTTIGTPHRGTPLADLGHTVGQRIGLARVLGTAADMIGDLTTASLTRFNTDVPDVSTVFYGSVVGRAREDVHRMLAPTHALLKRTSGDSDGIVPASSQEWGEVLLIVDADHWAQVGWSGPGDPTSLYEAIARQLVARGL